MSSKCLTLPADGSIAAVGRSDGSVYFWDVAGKKRLGEELKAHDKSREIMDLALTADKKTLVTADSSGEVKVWQLPVASYNERSLHTNKRLWPWPSVRTARFATVAVGQHYQAVGSRSGKELRQWDLHLPVLADLRRSCPCWCSLPTGSSWQPATPTQRCIY